MKRIYLIHGWDGNPENHWFPWLKKELESRGFTVFNLEMPDSPNPKIESWVNHIKKRVGKVDKDTYFIGHSIGCQAIMRYLEELNKNEKVGGIVFVAGWFNLPYLQTKEEKQIAKPWLETPINANKVSVHTKNVIAIFSDNDPDVSLEDSKLFKEKLGAKIIVEHKRGHFTADAGVNELPIVLKEILEMVK